MSLIPQQKLLSKSGKCLYVDTQTIDLSPCMMELLLHICTHKELTLADIGNSSYRRHHNFKSSFEALYKAINDLVKMNLIRRTEEPSTILLTPDPKLVITI